MQRPLAALAFAVALAAASVARAEPHQDAVRLFEAGRALRDRDKCVEALTAFKASVEIEPSVGGFFNIGICSEKLGQHAEALAAYRMSTQIAESKKDPRAQEGKDAEKALLGRTHWVLVRVPDDLARRPGLEIRLDGQAVPPERYNTHLFGPSAAHELRVRAAGRAEVAIPAPDQQAVTVELPAEKGTDPRSAAPPPPGQPPVDDGPRPPSMFASWGWQRWTGAGLGAAGVVTAAVGVFLTLDYLDEKASLEQQITTLCPVRGDKYDCPDDGARARYNRELAPAYNDNETSAQTLLPIVFGASAVLVAGGAVLFFTAPKAAPVASASPRPTLRVTPTFGHTQGVSVAGTF